MINYLGLEYEDFGRGPDKYDCLGLLIQIYKDHGIDIPDYAYKSPKDITHNQFIFDSQWETGDWEKVDNPKIGDVVMFKVAGHVVHIGIMVDQNSFIHAHESCGVAIDDINSIRWKNRLYGFYRHKSKCEFSL